MKACFLGIDIGTYESKGAIADEDGSVLASASISHSLSMPSAGLAEHDADGVWWNDFASLSRKLLQASGLRPEAIRGVGFSAIAPCVLPVDEGGRPLRPAILYGIDTRASEEIRELEFRIGRDEIFKRSGVVLSSQQTGPKILWIRKREPEIWRKTRRIMSSASYLSFKLTGRSVLDHYTASTFAPLYDPIRHRWSKDFSELVCDPGLLPELAWSSDIIGSVSAAAAEETGLAAGTPVVCGTADAAAEALSGGVSSPGDFMMMYGSSIFFIAPTVSRLASATFWPSDFLENGSFAVAGGMSTAGSITRWFKDEFGSAESELEAKSGKPAYASLAELAATSPPGANGVLALPYFYGERTPINDPEASGALLGLTIRSTRADVYRALLESVGYGVRHNLDILGQAGIVPESISAVGGGTKNSLWMQTVSDITGFVQRVPDNSLGACFGDAFLAATGTGFKAALASVKDWVKTARSFEPNPANRARYEDLYGVFRDLYPSTEKLMHRLAALRS